MLHQFAVGLVTAELLQAPRALHGSDGFDWSDKRSRQPQRQHQATEFTLERFQPFDEKRADETQNGKHREADHQLFRPVMQDVFKKIAVPPDEIPGDRVVEHLRQNHVQIGQFEQQQNDRRHGGNAQTQPPVQRS